MQHAYAAGFGFKPRKRLQIDALNVTGCPEAKRQARQDFWLRGGAAPPQRAPQERCVTVTPTLLTFKLMSSAGRARFRSACSENDLRRAEAERLRQQAHCASRSEYDSALSADEESGSEDVVSEDAASVSCAASSDCDSLTSDEEDAEWDGAQALESSGAHDTGSAAPGRQQGHSFPDQVQAAEVGEAATEPQPQPLPLPQTRGGSGWGVQGPMEVVPGVQIAEQAFQEPQGEADTCSSSDEDEQDSPRPVDVEDDGEAELWHTLYTGLPSPLEDVHARASYVVDGEAVSLSGAQSPAGAPSAKVPAVQLGASSRDGRSLGSSAPAGRGCGLQGPGHHVSATTQGATAARPAPGIRFTARMIHRGPRMPHYSPTGVVPTPAAPPQQFAASPTAGVMAGRAGAGSWPPRVVPAAGTAALRAVGSAAAAPGSLAAIAAGIPRSKAAPRTHRPLQSGQHRRLSVLASGSQGNMDPVLRPHNPCAASTPCAISQEAEVGAAKGGPCTPPSQQQLAHAAASVAQLPVGVSHARHMAVGAQSTSPQQPGPAAVVSPPMRVAAQGVSGGIFRSPQRPSAPLSSRFHIPGPQSPVVPEDIAQRTVAVESVCPGKCAQPLENIIAVQRADLPPAHTVPAANAQALPARENASAAQQGDTGTAAEQCQQQRTEALGDAHRLFGPPPCNAHVHVAVGHVVRQSEKPSTAAGSAAVADQCGASDLQATGHRSPVPVLVEAFAAVQHRAPKRATVRPEDFFSPSATVRENGAALSQPQNSSAHYAAVYAARQKAAATTLQAQALQRKTLHALTAAPEPPQLLQHPNTGSRPVSSLQAAPREAPASNPGLNCSDENSAMGVNRPVPQQNVKKRTSGRRRACGLDSVLRADGVEKAWNLNEEDTDDSGDESDAMSLSEGSAGESDSESKRSESDDESDLC